MPCQGDVGDRSQSFPFRIGHRRPLQRADPSEFGVDRRFATRRLVFLPESLFHPEPIGRHPPIGRIELGPFGQRGGQLDRIVLVRNLRQQSPRNQPDGGGADRSGAFGIRLGSHSDHGHVGVVQIDRHVGGDAQRFLVHVTDLSAEQRVDGENLPDVDIAHVGAVFPHRPLYPRDRRPRPRRRAARRGQNEKNQCAESLGTERSVSLCGASVLS